MPDYIADSIACELSEQEAQPVLCVHKVTPVFELQQVLGNVYGELGAYMAELGETPVGAPFIAYYNMDMQALDIDVGFPVSRMLPSRGEIRADTIPAGHYATCVHRGPYSEIGNAYERLTQWIEEKKLEPSGVAYEFYMNDPMVTAPEALLTEVRFLLKT